jgi:hypothetical protein
MSRVIVVMLATSLVLACNRGTVPESGESESAPSVALVIDSTAPAVVSPEELPAAVPAEPAAEASRRPVAATPKAAPPKPAAVAQQKPAEPPPPPPPPTAAVGTEIVTTSDVEITTRKNKAGEHFTATVSAAVPGQDGKELIPSGAQVTFTIVDIKEAENKNEAGVLVLRPIQVAVDGTSYPISADVTELAVERKGRGVTAGDAGKVAAGAAAGAILGKILTKKGTGAVVGGAVGAAAGTAIAVNSADKDLVVPAGARIVIKLTRELVLQP